MAFVVFEACLDEISDRNGTFLDVQIRPFISDLESRLSCGSSFGRVETLTGSSKVLTLGNYFSDASPLADLATRRISGACPRCFRSHTLFHEVVGWPSQFLNHDCRVSPSCVVRLIRVGYAWL